MPRYVAFLRGVSPMNAKMADLRRVFEEVGFTNVKTVRSSGNVAFDATSCSDAVLAGKVEAAMKKGLGCTFYTVIRSANHLRDVIDADPFAPFRIARNAKRVVTFLRDSHTTKISLPVEADGVRILAMQGRDVFTAYTPRPGDPVFMTMIERTFGANVTTRTWDTVIKCTAA